jgi:hypothetical protein
MFGEHRSRNGSPDAEAAIGGFLDRSHLGNFLDVDDQARPHRATAHLHQKIGAASHDARSTASGGKCDNRFIECVRRQVSEFRHAFIALSIRATGSVAPADAAAHYIGKINWNSLRDHGADVRLACPAWLFLTASHSTSRIAQAARTMTSFAIRIVLLAAVWFPVAGHAETKEEWIVLGARIHGGFGPFIPVGIRIGLDAMQRLKADRNGVTVLYYDAGLAPCPCVADGIMIATQATPGQKTLVMSPEKAPPETMAVIVIKNRKTNEAVRYSIAKEWLPKILAWRTDLDPSGRYDAGMNAEGLFVVEPAQ